MYVFADRFATVLNAMAGRHPGRVVAVCTHAGVTGQAMAHGCNSDPYSFSAAGNASISQIVVTEDRWRITRLKDAAHLMRLVTVS